MSTQLPNDISLQGLNFTRAREGRALRGYQDAVGVWTVGYGLTNYDKNLPWKIKKGLTISEEQAEWYLLKSLRQNYLPAVRKQLQGGTYAHPQGVIDGGTDFHFNTGGIAKATWPKALVSGDMAAAKESMLSWNKGGGRVLAGLVSRRAGNWAQVSAGDYGHVSGPSVVEPRGEGNREVITGTGDVLTAFPTETTDTSAGNIHVDGPTIPEFEAPGVLKLGSEGDEVSELQANLSAAGYPTHVTGTFDEETEQNVQEFQAAHPNLTHDGKVGPATRAALVRAKDMRNAAGKIIKTGLPAGSGIFIALHQWVSAHAGEIALGIGLTALAAVAGYYLWKHRHDAHGWINSVIGRVVQ